MSPSSHLLVDESAQGDAIDIHLTQQITSFKNLGLLHVVADVLQCTNQLSHTLQSKEAGFTDITTSISLNLWKI